jgi:TRAP transporter 4TM/12TM fusion protein
MEQHTTFNVVKQSAFVLAGLLAIFHIVNMWTVLPTSFSRGIHVGAVLLLAYARIGQNKNKLMNAFTILKVAIGVYACVHYMFFFEAMYTNQTTFDVVIGVLFVLVILDITFRSVGVGMGVVLAVFLIYVYVGRFMPGIFGHAGYSVSRTIYHLYVSPNGIFGAFIQISIAYIAMFSILGGFFEHCGASDSFIKLAMKVTGRMQGGPALAAVIASCLFGMVNGSAVVNVVTTGTLTIPLMKSLGIQPIVAGAVEAAASTGGQLMPPVMGAGAFIMADITGIPYSQIIIKALIPALVYFISVFFGVYFYVKRANIPRPDPNLIPSGPVILKGLYLLLPMFVVLVLILRDFSAGYSALMATFCATALILFREFKSPRVFAKNVWISLVEGSNSIVSIATALAAAGLIVGVVSLTGFGNRFVSLVITLSQGSSLLALIFVALACLILGMGLPTSAAYVLTATMAVPAMVQLKLPLIACHLFVFYFAVIAPVTPPVAIAAYAGAGIADASPSKTGLKAFVFTIPAFLVPFLFVYNPVLLAEGNGIDILIAGISAVAGSAVLAAGTQGYFFGKLGVVSRLILFIASLFMFVPGVASDLLGISAVVIIGIISFMHTRLSNKNFGTGDEK